MWRRNKLGSHKINSVVFRHQCVQPPKLERYLLSPHLLSICSLLGCFFFPSWTWPNVALLSHEKVPSPIIERSKCVKILILFYSNDKNVVRPLKLIQLLIFTCEPCARFPIFLVTFHMLACSEPWRQPLAFARQSTLWNHICTWHV